MRRNLLGIALLFMLVAPLVTTYSWLRVEKLQLRRAVKEMLLSGVEEETLVRLSFTETQLHTELRWEHADEFEYRDQMYDVVKKETQGDTTIFWCWPDHRESGLNQVLSQLVDRHLSQDPLQQDQRRQFRDFFQQLYCTSLPKLSIPVQSDVRLSYCYQQSLASFFPIPPVPPPELV